MVVRGISQYNPFRTDLRLLLFNLPFEPLAVMLRLSPDTAGRDQRSPNAFKYLRTLAIGEQPT